MASQASSEPGQAGSAPAGSVSPSATRHPHADRLAFLAEATTILASSLDYQITLANVAQLAVPGLADWCAVDTVDEDGSIRRVALVHVEPAKAALIRELWGRYPRSANEDHPVSRVLSTGQTDFVPEITDGLRSELARDADHRHAIESLDTRSRITVPLVARGRTLGAITFAVAGLRRFHDTEVTLAEDLASRAALAVDNARLHQEARDALARREALVRVARVLGAVTSRDQLLDELAKHSLDLVKARASEILLCNDDSGDLRSAARAGEPTDAATIEKDLADLRLFLAAAKPLVVSSGGERAAPGLMMIPLTHESRVVGAIRVRGAGPKHRFSQADLETLELFAGIAAAELVGLEAARREAEVRGRLDGVVLAGRELSHVLNNALTLPIGTFELLMARRDVPDDARELLQAAYEDLDAAEQQIRKFHQIVRVETKQTPLGPALDLERSTRTDST